MVVLVRYVSGAGKANEHDTPHVASGDDFLMSWFGSEELNRAGADEISACLERPRELYGTTVRKQVKVLDPETGRVAVAGYTDAHVWHGADRCTPRDPSLPGTGRPTPCRRHAGPGSHPTPTVVQAVCREPRLPDRCVFRRSNARRTSNATTFDTDMRSRGA